VPLFTSGGLGPGLVILVLVLVLVLRIWSCLHHCQNLIHWDTHTLDTITQQFTSRSSTSSFLIFSVNIRFYSAFIAWLNVNLIEPTSIVDCVFRFVKEKLLNTQLMRMYVSNVSQHSWDHANSEYVSHVGRP